MKKVKALILSSFILAVVAVNFSIVGNNLNYSKNFSLNSLQQAFANEIEEITITCDGGGDGICYEPCDEIEKYCNGLWIWSWDCSANGDTNSWCTPYDPC